MNVFKDFNFKELETDEIISFIEKKHHGYVLGMLDLLKDSCEKANEIDIKLAPELKEICILLKQFSLKVLVHIQNKEENLFPYVRKLLDVKRSEKHIKFINVNLMESTLKMLVADHNELRQLWAELKLKANNFILFRGASPITSLFYAELNDFEKEHTMHMDLEDFVLFPKFSLLEKEINKITDLAIKFNLE